MHKDSGCRLRVGLNPRYTCRMHLNSSVIYSANVIQRAVEVTPTASLREKGPVFKTGPIQCGSVWIPSTSVT
jgi:hypothetical protein